ncbi:sensor histidine kinase [Hydrogenophaga sp. PBL-H3]|uniref:sensor histidine kinase n=1 Tax=Hydrogenophaga sp. PBL-H3 TaxID=434010 RepID=UPI0013204F7C|nr:histidine kinase dimerization/phosphoacceptor domain -containing protein [Hydrogenophaga sp. PBL-H3]QHE77700.1 PAS domain S-box protein [Hydrogenophaga sp. PBL-H3]QHE82124.1 PAS domain S-box protein [Hydrogenophaga sp. PBL-H3]
MTALRIALGEYLGQAFNRIPVAMIVVNKEGTIVRLNELAETTFGYASEELIGQKVEVLLPPRYRHKHPGYRSGFLAEPSARPMGAGRDLSGLRKDGSEFPVEIGINPVETGEGPMILSVILDLSERKLSEKRIQDALQQKELLLKEVHHRVKNNLQVVHSLLDLQALKISDSDMVDLLRDSQNRIRSMSLIHQTLYQSQDFAHVDFQRFLGELLPRLTESYGARSRQVRIDIRSTDVKLPINDAIPCGLIVNELVSNALKHGFPEDRRGTVLVEIGQDADQVVELAISDDGQGIPHDMDLGKSESLGLQLVNLLTRQLHGQLEVRRSDPTRFTLRFRMGDKT